MGWQEPVKEFERIDFRSVGDGLGQVGEADQQQQDEGDGRQKRIERQAAGKEGNVVFVGRLEGTTDETGG